MESATQPFFTYALPGSLFARQTRFMHLLSLLALREITVIACALFVETIACRFDHEMPPDSLFRLRFTK